MRRRGEEVVGTGAQLSPLFIICCWLQHVVWKRGRRWRESGGGVGGGAEEGGDGGQTGQDGSKTEEAAAGGAVTDDN